MPLRPEYLTRDERRARGRIARARGLGRPPRTEDLALLAAAAVDAPVRRLAAAIAKLPPEQRARLDELLDADQEGAPQARSA